MPGLVPGIHVLCSAQKKDVAGRAFASPKRLRPRRRDKPGHDEAVFVDGIFTTCIDAAFTNVFAVKAETSAIACLCRARNAD
jgi:hypothetical protein